MSNATYTTPAAACLRIAIGRTKFYQLVAEGAFPTVKIGRATRVPIAALDAWVAAQTVSRPVGGQTAESRGARK